MRSFIQPATTIPCVAPAGGVTVDVPIIIGGIFGLPTTTAAAGETFALAVMGVFSIPKPAGVMPYGAKLFWDVALAVATLAQVGPHIGCVDKAAANGDTTVEALIICCAPSAKGHWTGVFDATGGKAVGAFAFGELLPDNAYITRFWYEVVTTFTSAADLATISLGIDTDDPAGNVAAVAINNGGSPWDAGMHDGIQGGAAANFGEKVNLAAGRKLTATVAVEALTAGKLIVHADYVVSV